MMMVWAVMQGGIDYHGPSPRPVAFFTDPTDCDRYIYFHTNGTRSAEYGYSTQSYDVLDRFTPPYVLCTCSTKSDDTGIAHRIECALVKGYYAEKGSK